MEGSHRRRHPDPRDLRAASPANPTRSTAMTDGYLVDTDWVIHHLNGHSKITKRLGELKNRDLAISLITLAELYDGIYLPRDPKGSEETLLEFLNDFRLIEIGRA